MLFAVLVASVLLSIGLSIFSLTVKELALSSSGRESQFAFYAADTGAECALYWDFKGTDIFATSSDSRNPSTNTPDCVDSTSAAQTINITPINTTSNSATTQFALTIPNTINGNSSPYCTTVIITKTVNNGITSTQIDSRGYNVGSAALSGGVWSCQSSDPNRVERALKITY